MTLTCLTLCLLNIFGLVVAVLVCGTGIGISIAANKVNGIRCALAHDHFTALMSRQVN